MVTGAAPHRRQEVIRCSQRQAHACSSIVPEATTQPHRAPSQLTAHSGCCLLSMFPSGRRWHRSQNSNALIGLLSASACVALGARSTVKCQAACTTLSPALKPARPGRLSVQPADRHRRCPRGRVLPANKCIFGNLRCIYCVFFVYSFTIHYNTCISGVFQKTIYIIHQNYT